MNKSGSISHSYSDSRERVDFNLKIKTIILLEKP